MIASSEWRMKEKYVETGFKDKMESSLIICREEFVGCLADRVKWSWRRGKKEKKLFLKKMGEKQENGEMNILIAPCIFAASKKEIAHDYPLAVVLQHRRTV